MDVVLSGLNWRECMVYVDDIIVFSRTWEQHIRSLRSFGDRLRAAGLKLNAKKCELARNGISYLGHVVNGQGIKPDPKKVTALRSLPVPKTLKYLQHFLGLLGYYRKFVRQFAERATPLYTLLKKGTAFIWTPAHQVAFEDLKEALSVNALLHLPDLNKPFVLKTDASGSAISAILIQFDEAKRERPVAYASRRLSAAERNWTASERECIALVWGVKSFHTYLYGRRLFVVTDHAALTYLKQMRDNNAKLMRWSLQLQEYDMEVIHKKGKLHADADALSRLFPPDPLPPPSVALMVAACPAPPIAAGSQSIAPQDRNPTAPLPSNLPLPPCTQALAVHALPAPQQQQTATAANTIFLTPSFLKAEQAKDEDCKRWVAPITAGSAPTDYPFTLKEGILLRKGDDKRLSTSVLRVVLPSSLRFTAIQHCHDHALAGHLKLAKTFGRLEARFWWEGMYRQTKEWIASCRLCQQRAAPPQNEKRLPLVSIPVGKPFTDILSDILGPLPLTRARNRFIVVVTDRYTNWVTAWPTTDIRAATVAKGLLERHICVHGCPHKLQSDKGT
jgi:hypothetical protein